MNCLSQNHVISTNEVLKILLNVGKTLYATMDNTLLINLLLFFIEPLKKGGNFVVSQKNVVNLVVNPLYIYANLPFSYYS